MFEITLNQEAFTKLAEAEGEDFVNKLYQKAEDGSYRLNINDTERKKQLNEFRNNNIKLAKELEAAKSSLEAYGEVSPDQIAELQKDYDNLKSNQDADTKDLQLQFEKRVQEKLEAVNNQHEIKYNKLSEQLEQERQRNAQLNYQINQATIKDTILSILPEIGKLNPGADKMIINEALQQWEMNDGVMQLKESVGADRYNDVGKEVSPQEWAKNLYVKHPYLFESNQGGGSKGETTPLGNQSVYRSGDKVDTSRILNNEAKVDF